MIRMLMNEWRNFSTNFNVLTEFKLKLIKTDWTDGWKHPLAKRIFDIRWFLYFVFCCVKKLLQTEFQCAIKLQTKSSLYSFASNVFLVSFFASKSWQMVIIAKKLRSRTSKDNGNTFLLVANYSTYQVSMLK